MAHSTDNKKCKCGSGKLLKNCEPCFSLIKELREKTKNMSSKQVRNTIAKVINEIDTSTFIKTKPENQVTNILGNLGMDTSKLNDEDLKFNEDGSLHITFEYGKDPVVHTNKRKH